MSAHLDPDDYRLKVAIFAATVITIAAIGLVLLMRGVPA